MRANTEAFILTQSISLSTGVNNISSVVDTFCRLSRNLFLPDTAVVSTKSELQSVTELESGIHAGNCRGYSQRYSLLQSGNNRTNSRTNSRANIRFNSRAKVRAK